MPLNPLNTYRDRQASFSAELASARKASSKISNARLGVFLASLAGFLWFVIRNDGIPALAFLFVGAVAFTVLVVLHGRILVREKLSARLAGINAAGIDRMEGRWMRFPVDGREFVDDAHPYSSDLDIFGPSSLFQFMNAAQTRLGRLYLRGLLTGPPRPLDRIAADQAMVKELGSRLAWRQNLQAAGRFLPAQGKEDPEALIAWAEDKTGIFPSPALAAAFRILPVLSFAFALYSFFGLGSLGLMIPPFLLHMAIAGWNQRRHGEILEPIVRNNENLEAYLDLLRLIEHGGFTGPGLVGLAESLRNPTGTPASEAVERLRTLSEYVETRRNPILHFIVNTLFLWDIQWLWAFRRWRRENGPSLRTWLETVARMESLSSLATLPFENPSWSFPEVAEGGPLADAVAMAHPLLPADVRVGNDLRLGRPGEILIITGSNMSGKSTLMRTVGINLVLAYAGAPVCAASFRCAPVEVNTSMRLRDDLEKRISSFYAELLRIKGIVEAARRGRKVLFLVDEIFRGTNSKDRHEGATAVLRQLHDLKAAGLVSTHDLELARLEEMEPGHFRNHHFQESYSEGKINFDFRLRPGVSTTTNAIQLIRMVGLG